MNYVEEIVKSGYTPEKLGDFHRFCLAYLGKCYFPEKNAPVLDLGIGVGHCAVSLLEAGWSDLYGFDRDLFFKNYLEEKGIKLESGDLEKDRLPFSNNFFSGIVSFHVVEHLFMGNNYIREIKRVLRPGGVAIIVTPDWRKQFKTFYRDQTHLHPYDKESIARLARSVGFDPEIKSFGVMRGFGRTRVWKKIPRLMFTGMDMICIVRKS